MAFNELPQWVKTVLRRAGQDAGLWLGENTEGGEFSRLSGFWKYVLTQAGQDPDAWVSEGVPNGASIGIPKWLFEQVLIPAGNDTVEWNPTPDVPPVIPVDSFFDPFEGEVGTVNLALHNVLNGGGQDPVGGGWGDALGGAIGPSGVEIDGSISKVSHASTGGVPKVSQVALPSYGRTAGVQFLFSWDLAPDSTVVAGPILMDSATNRGIQLAVVANGPNAQIIAQGLDFGNPVSLPPTQLPIGGQAIPYVIGDEDLAYFSLEENGASSIIVFRYKGEEYVLPFDATTFGVMNFDSMILFAQNNSTNATVTLDDVYTLDDFEAPTPVVTFVTENFDNAGGAPISLTGKVPDINLNGGGEVWRAAQDLDPGFLNPPWQLDPNDYALFPVGTPNDVDTYAANYLITGQSGQGYTFDFQIHIPQCTEDFNGGILNFDLSFASPNVAGFNGLEYRLQITAFIGDYDKAGYDVRITRDYGDGVTPPLLLDSDILSSGDFLNGLDLTVPGGLTLNITIDVDNSGNVTATGISKNLTGNLGVGAALGDYLPIRGQSTLNSATPAQFDSLVGIV